MRIVIFVIVLFCSIVASIVAAPSASEVARMAYDGSFSNVVSQETFSLIGQDPLMYLKNTNSASVANSKNWAFRATDYSGVEHFLLYGVSDNLLSLNAFLEFKRTGLNPNEMDSYANSNVFSGFLEATDYRIGGVSVTNLSGVSQAQLLNASNVLNTAIVNATNGIKSMAYQSTNSPSFSSGTNFGPFNAGGITSAGALSANRASGASSAILGGYGNVASGDYDFIGGSALSTANNFYDVILGSPASTASGISSGVYNSPSSTASGSQSAVISSTGSTISGNYGLIVAGSTTDSSGDNNLIVGPFLKNTGTLATIFGSGTDASTRLTNAESRTFKWGYGTSWTLNMTNGYVAVTGSVYTAQGISTAGVTNRSLTASKLVVTAATGEEASSTLNTTDLTLANGGVITNGNAYQQFTVTSNLTVVSATGAPNLTVTNSRVLIGNYYTAPADLLHVIGDTTQNAGIRVQGFGADSAIDVRLLGQRAGGTAASPAIVTNADKIFRFSAQGYDGSAYRTAGEIRLTVDGVPGASDMPGRWDFLTTLDGTTTTSIRMTIKNDGLITMQTNLQVGGTGIFTNGVTSLSTSSIPTNTANLTIATTDIALNTYYTNTSQRAYVCETFALTSALTGSSVVALYLDQGADGTFESTGMQVSQGVLVAEQANLQLGGWLQPGARYMFTNILGSGASASVVAGSGQLTKF